MDALVAVYRDLERAGYAITVWPANKPLTCVFACWSCDKALAAYGLNFAECLLQLQVLLPGRGR